APTKRQGDWQYQIFLPQAAVKAFAQTRRERFPKDGRTIDEARAYLRGVGLRMAREWLTRLCRALGVMKCNVRSPKVGNGMGLRLSYVLTNKDLSQIADALRETGSLREAVRLLRRAKRASRSSRSERRRARA